jgi:hypothetical protein
MISVYENLARASNVLNRVRANVLNSIGGALPIQPP